MFVQTRSNNSRLLSFSSQVQRGARETPSLRSFRTTRACIHQPSARALPALDNTVWSVLILAVEYRRCLCSLRERFSAVYIHNVVHHTLILLPFPFSALSICMNKNEKSEKRFASTIPSGASQSRYSEWEKGSSYLALTRSVSSCCFRATNSPKKKKTLYEKFISKLKFFLVSKSIAKHFLFLGFSLRSCSLN